MKITLFKGGSKESTVEFDSIVLPSLSVFCFDRGTIGCYAIMRLAYEAVRDGRKGGFWDEIRVPDLWHDYLDLKSRNQFDEAEETYAIWSMTHNLVAILKEKIKS